MSDSVQNNSSPSPEFDPYYEQDGDDSWLDDSQENTGEGPDTNFYGDMKSDISRDDIRKLYQGVDAKNLPNEKELLSTLRDALKDISSSDAETKSRGADLFYQIQESIQSPESGMSGDGEVPQTDENNNTDGTQTSGEGQGDEEFDTPTRTVKGVKYFESKSGEEFGLHPQGKGTENIVETSGNVTITPLDPKTPVEISQEGAYTVIKVKGDKEDVYKVKTEKVTQIQIDSETVSGDLENEDGKITSGAKGKKYISQEKINELAQKFSTGASLIGGKKEETLNQIGSSFNNQFYTESFNLSEGSKYSTDEEGKNKDVQSVLNKMSQAVGETDEKKKSALWEEISSDISTWRSQADADKMGWVNDRGQLLCDVLYGELGEDGLKKLLQEGTIPGQVVNNIIDILQAKPEENTSKEDADRIKGGHGWTHLTYAEFLKRYSSPSPSGA